MLASTGINAYSSRSFASGFASSSSSSSSSSSFRKAATKTSTTTNRFSALGVSSSFPQNDDTTPKGNTKENDDTNTSALSSSSSSFSFSKDAIDSASIAIGSTAFAHFVTAFPAFADLEAAPGVLDGQTSKSYYATLFLFVLSAPGLYSLVKRSAKSKISRKTFELPGPMAAGDAALPLDDVAREISMYFKRNNYVVADAGEVITFEGNIAPERGTAAYITFCIAVGLLCVGLVCSIALPGGNLWYSLALISPLSGKYYLDNAGRKEKVKVKMVDNEVTTDVIVEGDAEEIERFRRDLNLCEKGMVRVKGILEQ
ncbi:unnamed protein product [Bathycoccus prasinos]